MELRQQIMLDIETLGTVPGSVILSIGAVAFTRDEIGETFYQNIDPQGCTEMGLTQDNGTLLWWAEQPQEAKDALKTNRVGLHYALVRLSEFVRSCPRANIWGCGADFDKPLLDAAYRICGKRPPWGSFSGRCFRTMKTEFPGHEPEREGTHHNALDDALHQAKWLQAIWKARSADC